MPATAEEMEKNTSGIMAVKRRFRKTSPKGLKWTASFFRTMPTREPIPMDAIKRSENPYDRINFDDLMFIMFISAASFLPEDVFSRPPFA
jgi:hypothetical protein